MIAAEDKALFNNSPKEKRQRAIGIWLKDDPEGLREWAKSDLFFLARDILGMTLVESTHRPVCDFFIKKNPNKSIAEQDTVKERLLLYPRNAYKSSLDIADIVQWILNFPDIRILILTSVERLAVLFLDDVKKHFVINESAPTLMNRLFVDFCVLEKDLGNQTVFECPVRSKQRTTREPTILASSIESAKAGFHFDVLKIDDAVSEQNSFTLDQIQKVNRGYHMNRKLMAPYGYVDVVGTRYHSEDLYGEILANNQGETKVLCKPALLVKDSAKNKRLEDLEKDEYEVLFPADSEGNPQLTYAYLMREKHLNEEIFWGQYMMDPRTKDSITISRELIESHVVHHSQLPLNGPIVIIWDLAYSRKKGRDFSTGAVGMFDDKGSLYIVDLVRDRFGPWDLAKAIVALWQQWPGCRLVAIEDATGSHFLEPAIQQAAKEAGIQEMFYIDWFTPQQEKNAKHTRMAGLHPWLATDHLFFATHLPHLQDLIGEFERCLGQHHHDDIPDCISQFPRYAPRMQLWMAKEEIHTISKEQAAWNLIFEENCGPFGIPGSGHIVPDESENYSEPEGLPAEPCAPGLEPILGSGITG